MKWKDIEKYMIKIVGNYWLFGISIVLLGVSISLNISTSIFDNSGLIITFIGILATFIVVGNYAQVKDIETKFSAQVKEMERVFDKKIRDVKKNEAIPILIEINTKNNELIEIGKTLAFKHPREKADEKADNLHQCLDSFESCFNLMFNYIENNKLFIDVLFYPLLEEYKIQYQKVLTQNKLRMSCSMPDENIRQLYEEVFNKNIPDIKYRFEELFRKRYGYN